MRYIPFFGLLLGLACSSDNETLRSTDRGFLRVKVEVVDRAGQNSSQEKAIKDQLVATVFDHSDKMIRSRDDLNQLPTNMALPPGTYYVVVESKNITDVENNSLTHYAQTDLIRINEGDSEDITLTFNDHLTLPAPNGFFSSTTSVDEPIF